ncbi:hypothetical protein KIW84_012821 [Lathyrus oleraceus]|uniref:Flavodoxin-like domain-containing protein n=1 Tax=Pisum sativum TaxID=3888 RepID=A0A9D5GX70_PEA|nr:hypothetical protein KIW84_012821 [Pisum sativum]
MVALHEGRAIHGYAVRREIGLCDDVFETTLLDMYYKCGGIGLAASVFAKMDARKTTNVGSWNTLIAAYLQNGQAFEAFDLFRQMICRNVLPDLVTLANAILCYGELNYFRRGMSIHGYMITMGAELDLVASTALVDLYCKIDVTKARKLFERLGNKDAVVYNVMMTGYLENELPADAVNVFREKLKTNVSPNVALFLNLIPAVLNLRDIILVRSIHGYALRHTHISHVEIANQIIHTYAKYGYVVDARVVFHRMRTRDLVSWTSMMTSYIYHGHIDEAINLFLIDFFHGNELSVNNSLITTYAKSGKLHMARSIFEQMTELCLTSWNAMIGAYAMHGNYTDVLELFDHMKIAKVTPDEVTFTSILTACSHSGLVEEGGIQSGQKRVGNTEEVMAIVHDLITKNLVNLIADQGEMQRQHKLLILYATQTGNALDAAERLARETELPTIQRISPKLQPVT